MAKSTKMNLGNLKSLESKTFTKRKLIIDNYEVEVDEVFRDSKITELVKEFLLKLNYMKENNIEMNPIDYSIVLLLKYFTTIEIDDVFENQIQILSILIDLGYIEQILNAFPEKEMIRLTEKLKEFPSKIEKIAEELKKNDVKVEDLIIDEIKSEEKPIN